MSDKVLGMLSLCRRAGRLLAGFDVVKAGLQEHQVEVVLLASDLSRKTEKEIRMAAQRSQTPALTLGRTMDEIWMVLGRRSGVIGITDPGFARQIQTLIKADPIQSDASYRDNEEE